MSVRAAGTAWLLVAALGAPAAVAGAHAVEPARFVLRRGAADVGRRVTESPDALADDRRLFGGEPPRIAGGAVTTDTDHTGERAVAWYDAHAFRARE